jgi:hypothetical protein
MGQIEATKRLTADEKDPDAGVNSLWLICFTGRASRNYWWDLLTRPQWRHCYALQYQGEVDKWVLIDWRTGICEVVVFNHDELEYVFGYLKANGGTGVLYRRQIPEKEILYRIPLMFCVQAILQLLGLPTRWTWTPFQLYKRLIANGGEELLNYRSESHGKWRRWRRWPFQNTESNQLNNPGTP